jgi:flagellar hook-associated protein 1 FlgK
MAGSFQGIEVSSRALRAFQRQLDTTGHNIANVNTKGYSRQTVDLVSTDPSQTIMGKLLNVGTGVNIASINRLKDQLLEARKLSVQGDQGRYETNLSNLEKVQATFLDVDGKGVSNSLDYFFNSWSALGSNPTSMAAKQQVQFAGSDLAKKVRNSFENLDSQANSQEKLIERTLTDIQALADKVAELNINIKKDMAAGGSPNDMMDKRDEALSELSKLINIHTSQSPDGTLSVFMGSFALVDQVGSRPFPTTYDAATSTVSKDGLTWPITGGKLKGLFENVTQLNAFKGSMDTFANQLRNLVNTIHEGGLSNGATGRNFFNDSSPQTGARDFDLDPGILTNASLIATGTTSAKGDGSIALALSDLRNSAQAGLGNQTIGNFFSSFLGVVGSAVNTAKNNVETSYALTEQVDQQIQETSGVNLDDEMADMLKFQRSYQAAAKVLTMMDQNVGDLIDMLRR